MEGYKYLNLIDNTDGTVKYRAQAQVKDAAGNPLTSGALVKAIKVLRQHLQRLSPNGNFYFWNGSDIYSDTAGTQVLTPQSDIEMYLAASPPVPRVLHGRDYGQQREPLYHLGLLQIATRRVEAIKPQAGDQPGGQLHHTVLDESVGDHLWHIWGVPDLCRNSGK